MIKKYIGIIDIIHKLSLPLNSIRRMKLYSRVPSLREEFQKLALMIDCYTRLFKYIVISLLNPRVGQAPSSVRSKTIYFVVQNKNHVQIFREIITEFLSLGINTKLVILEHHHLSLQAIAAIKLIGLHFIPFSIMKREVRAEDLVCVAVDWAPISFSRSIKKLKTRGIRFVGFIDGARFSRNGRYRLVDYLLAWGPSGSDLGVSRTFMVGSGIIERKFKMRLENSRSKLRVIINYKRSDRNEQETFAWGKAAIEAAELIDAQPLFSVHPSVKNIPSSVSRDHRPIESLFEFSTLLITRGSTLIYEALAAGIAVIYFPEPNEKRVEFADPNGAFMVANSAEQALELAKLYAEKPIFPAAAADEFLGRHVSVEPDRSSTERSVSILLKVLHGPNF